jgi:hypothetical protein
MPAQIFYALGAISIAASMAAVPSGTPASPPATHVVTFRAADYAFTGPDTIDPGATTLRLINAGRETHQLVVFQLRRSSDPVTVMRTLVAGGRLPKGVRMGGVEGVGPGTSGAVSLVLTPSRYLIACGLPAPDGKTHLEKGMVRLLVVRNGDPATTTRLPNADITVRLVEYGFRLSSPLRAGRQRLLVENAGTQPHHLLLGKLHKGVTLADVDRWDGKGAPPFDDLGGVAGLSPGQANIWELSLAPGDYVMSCVLPDAKDGRPHYMHGMERVVHVPAAPASRP